MRFLKVNRNITKEELKPVREKIVNLGLIDKIRFDDIKIGAVYIYREGSNKEVKNYNCRPCRSNPNTKLCENFGKEITIEEFLKLWMKKNTKYI